MELMEADLVVPRATSVGLLGAAFVEGPVLVEPTMAGSVVLNQLEAPYLGLVAAASEAWHPSLIKLGLNLVEEEPYPQVQALEPAWLLVQATDQGSWER